MSKRPLLWISLAVALPLLWFGLPWLSTERGVERAWDNVIEAVADRDFETLGEYMREDYRDGFGLGRAEALETLRTVRSHFIVCTVARERAELVLDPNGQSATTRAVIRLGGQGSAVAQAAIQASTTTSTPTTFRWRRNSWKPWDWRLVSIENPDAVRALNAFQRQASSMGF